MIFRIASRGEGDLEPLQGGERGGGRGRRDARAVPNGARDHDGRRDDEEAAEQRGHLPRRACPRVTSVVLPRTQGRCISSLSLSLSHSLSLSLSLSDHVCTQAQKVNLICRNLFWLILALVRHFHALLLSHSYTHTKLRSPCGAQAIIVENLGSSVEHLWIVPAIVLLGNPFLPPSLCLSLALSASLCLSLAASRAPSQA